VVTLDEGEMDTEDPAFHAATGRLLGDARETAGLSQAAVAKRLGIAQSRIARLELGKRRLLYSEAVRLARVYGVDISAFDPRGRSPEAVAPLPGRRRRIDAPRERRRESRAD
jgi:transcriptional regulator with XRE-family HTH domain